MVRKREALIECHERIWMRLGAPITLIVTGFLMLTASFRSEIDVLIGIIIVFGIVQSQAYFPDIALYDEGLEIKTLNRTYFVEWDAVKKVHKSSLHTLVYVYSDNLSFVDRIWISYPFSLGFWRKCSTAATTFMKEKVGDRYFETI